MRSFFRYMVFFSITHLFFAVFLFFGLGIFTQAAEEQHPFLYPYILCLCVIATLVQSLVFTSISYFINIAGVSFFITALIVELLVANSLFFYSMGNQGYSEEVTDSILMNASLLAALFIAMLIKEYQAQES
jgi:hypothetical protein